MNKFWFFIIIISIVIGLINNRIDEMVVKLFEVPKDTLNALLKLGSMMIIYNGMFNIAIKSRMVDRVSKRFNFLIDKVFKIDSSEKELRNDICASFVCNLLGLGPANISFAIRIVSSLNNKDNIHYNESVSIYNTSMYLLINISSLCVLPLSLLSLRLAFKSKFNIEFIPLIFIGSLLTTIISILICKLVYKDK